MASLVMLALVSRQIKEAEPAVAVLASLGALSVAMFATKLSKSFFKHFIRPRKDLKKLGKWAVITGATDGIGREYGFALAAAGLNVVLISRTEAKLQAMQKEIETTHKGIQVKYVVCDYSCFDSVAQEKVKKAIQNLNVGVLINNVGVSYRYPQYYHEITDAEAASLIEMNVNSTTWMTRMVLPGMVQRKTGGAIVNMSSGSAMYTLPLLAGYSGAKSYIEKFSRALNAEYASKNNITVQCQIPFYVSTKLAKMRPSFTVPTPEAYVKRAMRWIGHADSAVASPYWPHAVMGYVMNVLPDAVVSKIIMNMHLKIRKKGLQKDAKLAAESGTKKKE